VRDFYGDITFLINWRLIRLRCSETDIAKIHRFADNTQHFVIRAIRNLERWVCWYLRYAIRVPCCCCLMRLCQRIAALSAPSLLEDLKNWFIIPNYLGPILSFAYSILALGMSSGRFNISREWAHLRKTRPKLEQCLSENLSQRWLSLSMEGGYFDTLRRLIWLSKSGYTFQFLSNISRLKELFHF
jgi:hypothetical protein